MKYIFTSLPTSALCATSLRGREGLPPPTVRRPWQVQYSTAQISYSLPKIPNICLECKKAWGRRMPYTRPHENRFSDEQPQVSLNRSTQFGAS